MMKKWIVCFYLALFCTVVAAQEDPTSEAKAAMEELSNQSKQALNGQEIMPHVYPHQIAFNLLPHIDVFLGNGYSKEEMKMIQETRKIMHADEIEISATCVRVPVFIGHSEAVHVEFAKPMSPEQARDILSKAPGVQVMDDPDINMYPVPIAAAGRDETFVGRIRADLSNPNGLVLWIVSDNLRKGAALNAIQIAEEVIKRGLLRRG